MQEVSDDSDVRLMFVRDIAVVLANTHTRYCLLTTQADDDTNAMVVKTYGAGDYFGELALMTNQPRAATVRAIGNDGARCLKLQRATFDKFAQGCKAILDERAKMYREEKERQKAEREAERARVRAEREAERARKAEEREEEKRKREREREEQRLAREAAKAARGVEKAEQAAEKKATEVAAAVAEAAPVADAQEEEAGGGTTDDSQPEDSDLDSEPEDPSLALEFDEVEPSQEGTQAYRSLNKAVIREGVESDSPKVGNLEPGEVFNVLEMKEMPDGARRVRMERGWVSVTAKSGKSLLVDESSVQKFLRTVPLLQQLSDKDRAGIADVLEVEEFVEGMFIVVQGEEGDSMYFLEAGSAQAEVVASDEVSALRCLGAIATVLGLTCQ